MTTHPNSTTCARCGKWTVAGAAYCHHCANPLKSQFQSVADPGPVETRPTHRGGFFNSDTARLLVGAFIPPTVGAYLAWLNGYEPGAGAVIVSTVAAMGGGGLLLLRWSLARPVSVERPKPQGITVTMREPLPSGQRVYLDKFQDAGITTDDLHQVAGAVLAGKNFSREVMVKAGLSQPKARRVQSEFLRLNYACPLPNGKPGYILTLRGRRLLVALSSVKGQNDV